MLTFFGAAFMTMAGALWGAAYIITLGMGVTNCVRFATFIAFVPALLGILFLLGGHL